MDTNRRWRRFMIEINLWIWSEIIKDFNPTKKYDRNQSIECLEEHNHDNFEDLEYSMSPSPKPLKMRNRKRNIFNPYNKYIMDASPDTAFTNATSTTNTFIHHHGVDHHHIPQPRASVIEKTFTWSDFNENKQIAKPFISRKDSKCSLWLTNHWNDELNNFFLLLLLFPKFILIFFV